MAKILIIGDTHLGARNGNIFVRDYCNEFFQEQLFPYIQNHKNEIDLIIHLGDLLDNRKFINFMTYTFWLNNFIEPLNNFNIPIHLIVGNHCTYFKSHNDVNSPEILLKHYKNFKVFKDVYENKKINSLYIPWITPDNINKTTEAITKSKSKFVFGHLELSGFQMLSGLFCQHSLLSTNLLFKFNKVFSGHFHWKSETKNINYLGSSYQLSWSDYNNKKGFHIFDTETEELTFIENAREQYIKIEYDDSSAEATFLSTINFEQYRNKFIKLIVRKKSNPYLFSQFLESLYGASPVQIQITDIELEYTNKEIIADVKDINTIIQDNVNNRNYEEDIKPKLINYLNNLYNKTLV